MSNALDRKTVSKLNKIYHLDYLNARWIIFLSVFVFFGVQSTHAQNNKLINTIVIDPGHGGHDPGNLGTGRYKTTEKHIALDISLKLGDYIAKAFPEIKILYTRKTYEGFMELHERTQFANDNNADLFISVHCDAFTNPDAFGAGVYVMGMSKLKANMDIAMKENAVIYLEDDYKENYEGFDPNSAESYIIFSLTQNTHLDQSLHIAQEVEQQFATRANRKSRGVKQAPFYVISRANMPSILIETGFLTNPKEEDFLHSDEGQDYLASAIFRAFRSYKENIEALDIVIETKKELKENTQLQSKRTKIPDEQKIILEEIVFKVQIGTFLKSMKNDQKYLSLHLDEEIINGTYKCYTGATTDKSKADKLRHNMIEQGFGGAFVVAFYEGKRISTKEALDLQHKNYNHD